MHEYRTASALHPVFLVVVQHHPADSSCDLLSHRANHHQMRLAEPEGSCWVFCNGLAYEGRKAAASPQRRGP